MLPEPLIWLAEFATDLLFFLEQGVEWKEVLKWAAHQNSHGHSFWNGFKLPKILMLRGIFVEILGADETFYPGTIHRKKSLRPFQARKKRGKRRSFKNVKVRITFMIWILVIYWYTFLACFWAKIGHPFWRWLESRYCISTPLVQLEESANNSMMILMLHKNVHPTCWTHHFF